MFEQNVEFNIPNTSIYAGARTRGHLKGLIANFHYHEEIELLIVKEGTLACHTPDKVVYGDTGDVIFINSAVPHKTEAFNDGVSYCLLQFKESDYTATEMQKIIKYSIRYQGLSEEPVAVIRADVIAEEFEKILFEAENSACGYEIMIKSSILRIIATLYRIGVLSHNEEIYNTATGQKILPALEYINQNYRELMSLEEISSMLGFNESYFCRIFKQATGTTFTEYLNFVRVCKAEKMLSQNTGSITEIAEAVGFCSVSYFNRIFKKYKNCSPGYYRHLNYCKNI